MNPPKPTALKILQGNPGKRPLNHDEPKPVVLESAAPPEWLDEVARKEWDRLLPILAQMRVLTVADAGAFAEMCATFSQLRQMEQDIKAEGYTVVNGKGGLSKHPAASIREELRKTLLAYQREFGLVPASRSRVKVADAGQPKNKWANVS